MSVIELSNGKTAVIINNDDIVYLANEHMGHEYGALIESIIDAQTASEVCTKEKVNSDLTAYEAELESVNYAVLDVRDSLDKLEDYLKESKRLSRDKLYGLVSILKKELNKFNA